MEWVGVVMGLVSATGTGCVIRHLVRLAPERLCSPGPGSQGPTYLWHRPGPGYHDHWVECGHHGAMGTRHENGHRPMPQTWNILIQALNCIGVIDIYILFYWIILALQLMLRLWATQLFMENVTLIFSNKFHLKVMVQCCTKEKNIVRNCRLMAISWSPARKGWSRSRSKSIRIFWIRIATQKKNLEQWVSRRRTIISLLHSSS